LDTAQNVPEALKQQLGLTGECEVLCQTFWQNA
jgi:hypothetical protein